MWSRGNIPILVLGMYTGIATVENSMEVSKKSKNTTNIWSSNSKPRYVSEKNTSLERCMHPMFIAALFTIDNLWMYPKCSSADKWIKNGYTHNGILHSHKKE